ncbi:MAG: GNAT family N-acetyltransferase [Myxococcales bacterium]
MGPPLTTARLHLREWHVDDAEDAFEIYGDPEVIRFFGTGPPVPDVAAQQLWLAERIERHRAPAFAGMGAWALVESSTQRPVGTLLLKPIPPANLEIEIGWHLARRCWGKGYASEGARAVLRYGLADLGLSRICAVMHPDNHRSSVVARRIGMKWVERTRQYYEGEELDLFAVERNWLVSAS